MWKKGSQINFPKRLVPAPPTKSTRGITASWHNKPKSTYYSDPKISEEEFERRKHLQDGQHLIFVERELDAELSAASRPAVAPTPDVVWVPLPVSETTATSQVPCPVPLSRRKIFRALLLLNHHH